MEKTSSWIVLFYLIAFNIICTKSQINTGSLIDFTCKQTKDYNLCFSTLSNDPGSRSATEIRALATLLVKHVSDKASLTRIHIATIRNDPKTDWKTKQLLEKCVDRYNSIMGTWLEEVITSMAKNDYNTARESMAAIPSNVEMCERSFEWEGHVKSPISNDSKVVDDLAKVAYEIVFYKYEHPAPPSMK